jgi:hypothetical protein
MSWLGIVRARSFAHLYMSEPTGEPLRPHLVWQAPFVLATPDDDLRERVARAGELWLVNYDLRPYRELIISSGASAIEPWFMAFQRGERPDEAHVRIAMDRRGLDPRTATPLFELPLVFREREQSAGRDVWRKLAAM